MSNFKSFLVVKQTQNGSIWARIESETTGYRLIFLYAGKLPIALVRMEPNWRKVVVPEMGIEEECLTCQMSKTAGKIEREIISYLN